MNTLTKVPTPASTTPTYAPVLAPASFSELVQFAQMAAKSQLVPKEYRNQPEDIMLAVQLGSEVGLRPHAGAAEHRGDQWPAGRVG